MLGHNLHLNQYETETTIFDACTNSSSCSLVIMNSDSRSAAFRPEKDIPPLDGQVILVTGGNTGLGKQSVLELSRHRPAQIWLAARDLRKAQSAFEEIKEKFPEACIKILELDLSSLKSVKDVVKAFTRESDRLGKITIQTGLNRNNKGK